MSPEPLRRKPPRMRARHNRTNARRRAWRGMLSSAVAVVVMVSVGMGTGLFATGGGVASATAVAVPHSAAIQTAAQPPVPPTGNAYLGAFVDPAGTALTSSDQTGSGRSASAEPEISQLPQLNANLPRPLSIVPIYASWGSVAADSPLITEITQIYGTGAIPMITWGCGVPDTTVVNGGLNGVDDALVSGFAGALAASKIPVFLSWYPDANTDHSCVGKAAAAGYVLAWQHIHTLFQNANAGNVSFVWSIDTSQGNSKSWHPYYPTSSYVDWIAADNSYTSTTPAPAGTVTSEFDPWYSAFSTEGKPMMISNTAAPAGTQVGYLQQLRKMFESGSYPLLHGAVYFDAPFNQSATSVVHDELTPDGQRAFQTVANDPYFQPARQASSIAVSASTSSLYVGQPVSITASVGAADLGGSVEFLDNGTPIPDCTAVPVLASASCETSSLSLGSNQLTAVYSGDSQFAPSTTSTAVSVGVTPIPSGSPLLGQPSIPADGQTYLGAYVKPLPLNLYPPGSTPTEAELGNLPSFNQPLSRSLSFVHVFQSWSSPTPKYQLQQVIADGGIPMIDWTCGIKNANAKTTYATDQSVVSGTYDQKVIVPFAQELASLDSPVFLRWYYEPNITGSTHYQACIDDGLATPPTPGSGVAYGPSGYVAAWQHIWSIIHQYAPNVSFVWCMSTSGSGQDLLDYYPGSQFVDWIGADGYDRPQTTSAAPTSFTVPDPFLNQFQPFYSEFSSFGKPMIIPETAAYAGDQVRFFHHVQSDIPADFPALKGLGYFDAPGAHGYWPLTTAATKAFAQLSSNPQFLPGRLPAAVSGISAPTGMLQGQEAPLSVTLSTNDLGGSVSFYANGAKAPLRGCASVPVTAANTAAQGAPPVYVDTSSCLTDALPSGTNSVVAAYSGDAQFSQSSSPAAALTVGPQTPAARLKAPTIPGASSAYLGAWINPTGSHQSQTAEISALPGFNGGLGRPLSVVHLYQGWNTPVPPYALRAVLADQAIPMIDWGCGDTNQRILVGVDDPMISRFASELAAMRAPMFLRWNYDWSYVSSTASNACNQQASPEAAQFYRAAFQHIFHLFQKAGAYNVAFVWNWALGGTDSTPDAWYPGSAYVDWISADGFATDPTLKPGAAEQIFGSWYRQFSQYGKPLMIADTGAPAGQQSTFLANLATVMERPSTNSTGNQQINFPLVKALIYYDAPGRLGKQSYTFDSAGLGEIQALSRTAYFQPGKQHTATAVSATPNHAVAGQSVQLAAAVQNADNGGTVSYLDNGAPITGCQGVPLVAGGGCTTKASTSGNDLIQGIYSGDAAFDGSASQPASVSIASSTPGSGGGGGGSSSSGAGGAAASAATQALLGGQTGLVGLGSFSGLPTVGSVGSAKLPGNGAPQATRFGPYGYAAAGATSGKGGSDPILPGVFGPLGKSYGGIAVLIGLALVACFGAYIASTWLGDKRRVRRSRAG